MSKSVTVIFPLALIAAAVAPSVTSEVADVIVGTSFVPVMLIVTVPVSDPSKLVTVNVSFTV